MSSFCIRVTNKDFESESDTEAADPMAARAAALRGALRIGIDEICKGNSFFGAEVAIEENNEVIERLVIAMGASPLR